MQQGSANGYVLELDGYVMRAYWPAPWFVLIPAECPEDGDEPMLIHCEDRAHASVHARSGILLDSEFNRV